MEANSAAARVSLDDGLHRMIDRVCAEYKLPGTILNDFYIHLSFVLRAFVRDQFGIPDGSRSTWDHIPGHVVTIEEEVEVQRHRRESLEDQQPLIKQGIEGALARYRVDTEQLINEIADPGDTAKLRLYRLRELLAEKGFEILDIDRIVRDALAASEAAQATPRS